MSYQVLARKWRPRSFREMVGQTHVLKALINALDNQRLHHAYLFTGTRGVGKTTIARIIAKCLNCETGITSAPCGTCSVCREIDEGRFVDLIEIDAASRTKVEDTRELLDNVQYAPSRGRFKVYLIDEVHMLSSHSFNALLKTLEEPPPYVKFILATTDPQKLPATILSRCLQFSLKNMSPERVVEHLSHVLGAENVPFEDDALWLLGRAADGSMRDAMSLTDQAIAFGEGKVLAADVRAMLGTLDHGQVYGVLQALLEGDARALLEAVRDLAEQGPDWNGVLSEMLNVLHRVAIAQALPEAVDNGQGDRDRVLALAGALPAEDVQFYYQMGLIGRRDLPLAPDPRGGFEMVLLRMLAFRPADAEGAPTPVLKPVGISQATADSTQAVAVAAAAVESGGASTPDMGSGSTAAVAANDAAVASAPMATTHGAAQDAAAANAAVVEPRSVNTPAVDPQGASAVSAEVASTPMSAAPQASAVAPEPAAQMGNGVPPAADAAAVPASQQASTPGATSAALDATAAGREVASQVPPAIEQAVSAPASSTTGTAGESAAAGVRTPSQAVAAATPPEEVLDLPWEEPAASRAVTEPASSRQSPSRPYDDEPPFDPSAYASVNMDSDEDADDDFDVPEAEPEPVGFSYLDELAEHVQEDAPVAPPEPAPAAKPATGLALQWLELFPQLAVSGMTGNIAANCTLISAEGDDWLLHLDPGQGALFNSTQQRRLNEALNQHLGRTLRLQIELIRPEQETPAQAAARKRAERQHDAEASIEQDPLIQQMVRQFGAKVRHDTIEPVDAALAAPGQ